MREVWLIRHGESEGNAGLKVAHPLDIHLTARGRAEAACVAGLFEAPPARIIVSPYPRTKETAAPLRARFPEVPVEEWPVQEFTFLSPFGREGLTMAEMDARQEAYWRRGDPDHIDGEGAESFAMFMTRVRAAADRIAALGPGLSVLFGHGRFTRALLWQILFGRTRERLSLRRFHHLVEGLFVPNAALLRLTVTPGGRITVGPVETGHLEPLTNGLATSSA